MPIEGPTTRQTYVKVQLDFKTLMGLIPEYDGKSTTLGDFIAAVDYAYEKIAPEDEAIFTLAIKSKLSDRAKTLISSRNLDSWVEIRNILQGNFGDPRDINSLIRSLTNMTQSKTESPRTFISRIQNILPKIRAAVHQSNEPKQQQIVSIKIYETMALNTILSGLNEPLGINIRSRNPTSIEDAVHHILEEENIQFLKNKKSEFQNTNNQKPHNNFKSFDNSKHFKPSIKTEHIESQTGPSGNQNANSNKQKFFYKKIYYTNPDSDSDESPNEEHFLEDAEISETPPISIKSCENEEQEITNLAQNLTLN